MIPNADSCPLSLHVCSLAGLCSYWRDRACGTLDCGTCGEVAKPWLLPIYACLLLKGRYSLSFQFQIKCFHFSPQHVLGVCVGMNGVVYFEIKELSIKFLFLVEPEVHCSDNVTHSGPVCEVLLLPSDAAELLKKVKGIDSQHLWFQLLYVSPCLSCCSHCCIKQRLIIKSLIRRTYGRDELKTRE